MLQVGTVEIRFGKEVRRCRDAKGLSQEELADRAEVHSTYISQLERGLKSPTLKVIVRLARALDRPASEIIRAVEMRGHSR
ncbi:MAG: helix-turn-helix transcriptional regulator [Rhizobacter sp.]|nr:helix-turn-helix transcriptional regulator [Rhizobacter sp.]